MVWWFMDIVAAIATKYALKFASSRIKHKHTWVLVAYSTALAGLLLVFNLVNNILPTAGDIEIYYTYASFMLNGLTPYHDFRVEYPPLALVFFLLPAWVSTWFGTPTLGRFAIVFHTECFMLAVGTLVLVSATWRLLWPQSRLTVWTWRLGCYTIGALIISLYLLQRFDIAAAALTALALWLFYREKPGLTGVVIGVGTLAKLYPALLLPLLVIYCWQTRHKWAAIIRLAVGFGATCLAVMLPIALLVTPGSLYGFLEYHAERGIQTESVFASFILVGRALGLTTASISDDHGSLNLTSDWAKPLASFSTLLTLVGIVVIYWLLWRRLGSAQAKIKIEPDWIMQAAAILILWFVLANKVLSPQYLIWLLPFLPFWRGAKVWLYLVALALSFIAFPFLIVGITHLEPLPYLVLAVRNTLLIIIFGGLLSGLLMIHPQRSLPQISEVVRV